MNDLETNGFAIWQNSLDEKTAAELRADLAKLPINQSERGVYGVRNLLDLSPKIRDFSKSEATRNIVEKFLDEKAKVVRAIYFDKNPSANWKVPWHQDLTISVAERIETQGFAAWSVKDGANCVQPPVEILERMLTLRFHLDDADETNGALKVLPETHKLGRLNATEIQKLKSKKEVVLCKVKSGDCLLMKPLLLHSSSAGNNPRNRRVIHLEFAAEDLPNGLKWYGS